MFDLDKWQEIYYSLKKHKLRTGLTAFGVFWGVFMLVMLLGVGNGLRNNALAGFGGSANTIYIWVSSRTQLPYEGFDKNRWIRFPGENIEALRASIPEADVVIGINEMGGWRSAQYTVHNDKSDSFITRGTHPEVAAMRSYKMATGRFINRFDNLEKRKVAIIGQRVYQTLYEPGEEALGSSLIIGGIYFKVVGIFAPSALGDNAERDAEMILIPNQTLRYTFNQTQFIGHIRLTPKAGVPADIVEQKALSLLREWHHIHPEDKGVFGSYNTEKTYMQLQGLFTGISSFSWFVALGTILAGVIGVGNIMLIIVKERTREIGLRKALGAPASSIVIMVVQEAIIITGIAGYSGLVVGVFTLELVQNATQGLEDLKFFQMAEIDFRTAITAIVALILAGFLASLLPATKAAKVNPIVALQDE